mmetsp:Transcript_5586/g.5775  ORF Transcript_5586/g.5775 Transcript_5586/m.5775 type:complete len:294 (+) Transcript_5586:64-945(+)
MDELAELHSKTVGSGTDSKEKLLQQELQKLNTEKLKMKSGISDYVSNHPEFLTYIDLFVSAVLENKPNDVIAFGADFFTKLKYGDNNNDDEAKRAALFSSEPIVFAGPSGVGKGTIVAKLMSLYPNHFGFCVSHTTRQPRPGEENGVHYHFVEKQAMEIAIANGEFIEFANVHTNIYGTSYAAVQKVQSEGKICILDIDIQGVQQVKKSSLQCKYIFINPPSVAVLEQRLRGRGTETEEKVKVRLANAKGEMDYGAVNGNFDAIVINDDLDTAVKTVIDMVSEWYPQREFFEE